MHTILRFTSLLLLAVVLLAAALLAVSPAARQIAPTWLYYDLIGQRLAPAPPALAQYVQQLGTEYCERGHDSDCGGYRLVRIHTVQPNGAAAAWCVDYVVRRRNSGRLTSSWLYWANIPAAAVISQASDGSFSAAPTAQCSDSAA